MRRSALFPALLLLALFGGCATTPPTDAGGPENTITGRPAAASVDVGVDWSYAVSGDAAIRPIQVFSLNGKTYLQMRQNQLLPVILVDGTPVSFQISPPYLVIQGTPDHIDLVANGWRAIVNQVQEQRPALPTMQGQPVQNRVQTVSSE